MADDRFQFSTRRWLLSCLPHCHSQFFAPRNQRSLRQWVTSLALFALALITKPHQFKTVAKQVVSGYAYGIVSTMFVVPKCLFPASSSVFYWPVPMSSQLQMLRQVQLTKSSTSWARVTRKFQLDGSTTYRWWFDLFVIPPTAVCRSVCRPRHYLSRPSKV